MPKSFMNIHHNMRLVVAAVFIGIMSVVFLGNSTQAFAQEPPTPTPLQGGITVTQPVTGSGPTSIPNTIVATATTESSDVVADESGSENVLEDDTNLATDEPATTSQPESNPKSYTRFMEKPSCPAWMLPSAPRALVGIGNVKLLGWSPQSWS